MALSDNFSGKLHIARHWAAVYGVSDGAPWIAHQFELLFGENHSFTVDLFHVCEHLAEAALAFVANKDDVRKW
ncbi:MAG: hypothetical protein FWD68_16250, partial [Alphaproteobacteria bacterium]|nr:hypothetical protein [Alphaproteobacteria bacterium]